MKFSIILLVLLLVAIVTLTTTVNGKPPTNLTLASDDTRAEIFRADFSKSSLSAAFGGVRIQWGNSLVNLWASGLGIEVTYPQGSYGGANPVEGGFGLSTEHKVSHTAIFKYSVFFPADFNFVKGGKLPGVYGGKITCSGGDIANDCFSTRIMWRSDGRGELYLYANRDAQDPAICEIPNNDCNPDYGWSLDRGAFTFKKGEWTDLELRVTLNTPGKRDGTVAVKYNGNEVIKYTNIVYRIANYPNLVVDGLHVKTFFGGSTSDWASPKKQIVKFRDFILLSE